MLAAIMDSENTIYVVARYLKNELIVHQQQVNDGHDHYLSLRVFQRLPDRVFLLTVNEEGAVAMYRLSVWSGSFMGRQKTKKRQLLQKQKKMELRNLQTKGRGTGRAPERFHYGLHNTQVMPHWANCRIWSRFTVTRWRMLARRSKVFKRCV